MRSVFAVRKRSLAGLLLITPAIAGVLLIFLPKSALAANPTTINFQGKIVNADGTNVTPNGTYPFVFRIYNTASPTTSTACGSDSTCLFEETQSSVTVTNGVFQVELGSSCSGGLVASNSCTKSVAGGIDFNAQNALYLTLKFNNDTSTPAFMSPTIHMTTVPYAFNADHLGGIASTGFIQNNAGAAQSSTSFHIDGTGIADTQLQSPLFDTATSNGTLGIGTTNAGVLTIGNTSHSTVLFNLVNSSATALQVKNGSGNALLTVDTSGNDIALGKIGTGGINGSIVFNTTNASNTTVTISAASTGTSYSLTLPTTGPSTSQCLKTDASTASLLTFASCGGGGGTLASDYNSSGTTGNAIALASAGGGVIIKDAASPISGSLFSIQDNSSNKFLDVTSSGINIDATSTITRTHSGNLTLNLSDSGTTKLLVTNSGGGTGVISALTGYEINNGSATTGHYLRGNGTNYVDSALLYGDLSSYPTACSTGSAITALAASPTCTSFILNQTSAQTSTSFHIDGTGTADVSFSSPSFTGAAAVTLSSGGSSDLTLNSASNIIQIAAANTTLQRKAAGDYTIDLKNNSTNTRLLVTNSGTSGTAVISAQTGYQINGGSATTGHYLRGNGTNYVDSGLLYSDLGSYPTGCGTGTAITALAASPTCTGFILNQTGTQTSASFNIDGTGTAGTSFSSPSFTGAGLVTLSSGGTSNLQLQSATGIVALNKTGVNNEIDVYENSSNGTNYAAVTVTDTTATFQSHGGVTHIGGGTGAITVGSSTTTGITIAGSSSAPITITGNAASTWSTSAGNALTITGGSALSLDSGTTGAINLGTNANNKTITIGAGGSTSSNSTVDIANSSAGAQTVVLGSTSSTSTTTIQGGSGNTGVNILSGGNVQIGTSDTTGTLLITDTKTNAADPTGVNGAIYYNAGGNGGASNVTTYGGKFRCFEGGVWRDCLGLHDMVERRFGYAVPITTAAVALTGVGMTMPTISGSCGTAANGATADSNYIKCPSSTTSPPKGSGYNDTGSENEAEARWLPKFETKITVDGSLTATGGQLWVGLTSASLLALAPPTTVVSNATVILAVGFQVGVNGGKFLCVSGDGSNITGTDTGVTATNSHVYDIIIDYSTTGELVCSIADDGATGSFVQGAFTSILKTSNTPAAANSTGLGIDEEEIVSSGAVARNLSIAYLYLETN